MIGHQRNRASEPLYACDAFGRTSRLSLFRTEPTLCFNKHIHERDSTSPSMSSPASRRSKRNSLNSTPARGSHTPQQPASNPQAQMDPNSTSASQQGGEQATPQAPRQNIASSSPLFFRSSPSNASQTGQPGPSGQMEISSPLKQVSNAGDEDRTPRASRQAPAGELCVTAHYGCN